MINLTGRRAAITALVSLVSAWPISMSIAAPQHAAPALSHASSAELQKLLSVQIGKLPVRFSNHKLPRTPSSSYDRLFMWNEIALDTTAIDHTPVQQGETRIFGEALGPARSSRAMAIVHIAMFEAVNCLYQQYKSYTGLPPQSGDISVDAAIARAAHDALVFVYPSQAPRLDALFAADIATIVATPAELAAGDAMGLAAAQSIVTLRTLDGSEIPEPTVGVDFFPKVGIGYWSPDPVSGVQTALGAYWNQVKPFVMTSASQFRAPPPPSLKSKTYSSAFLQTDALGGDPLHGTQSLRTAHETFQGIFWTYDGTPALCAPPRMYNQVARTLAFQQGIGTVEDAARYLALINTTMADAGISAWDGKWFYQFWRPITAIRAAGSDGNPDTKQDATWYPLGAQATNTHGPNFTPPFPAYPSGHATFGGALFQILRHYWPDKTPFTFTSDEFNGQNYDIYGNLMKLHPVNYGSFTAAEYDNAESRIWIGVHWQFDADEGVREGNKVADYVFKHAFQRVGAP